MRSGPSAPPPENLLAWLSEARGRVGELRQTLAEQTRLEPELTDLRLEVRRLKAVGWVLVGVLGLVVISSVLLVSKVFFPAESNEIRARRFSVVDDSGTTRVRLGLLGEEGSTLELADSHGTGRVAIVVRPDGASAIELLGEERRPRVRLDVGPDGSPRLELRG